LGVPAQSRKETSSTLLSPTHTHTHTGWVDNVIVGFKIVYVYIYTLSLSRIHMHTHARACTRAHTHTRTQTHTHTLLHTHTHTGWVDDVVVGVKVVWQTKQWAKACLFLSMWVSLAIIYGMASSQRMEFATALYFAVRILIMIIITVSTKGSIIVCDSALLGCETFNHEYYHYYHSTNGGDRTLNNYDCQNFLQVFTEVPIHIKHVFTGVPKFA